VPRTHQFLVTLTVHTNKINPTTTPTTTSATSMTETALVVAIPRDAQHVIGQGHDAVGRNPLQCSSPTTTTGASRCFSRIRRSPETSDFR
jgi:hypothetical protein